ncbi:Thioesterase/thiol ester dehydrase-isomerase [Sodiomyces alkalinus F11]|uniref:Thioesterase/thiol ester dehydrase-isomerase n=1 Tax=Sodiomyces alkalinus (strain CBS 110278 / VKM F-3762 / F11) TaxID=1314773 RepID=A0A3N2Q214_SODAK|nr:Thioesterase/thiol ester dehydrase-isomerase [Sodiomyces alkalinus F11]ROT40746.1 Thioesterase/thiol ester dehydrase-isomerase [Sodiomyces alkalinus F11]
MRSLSLPIRRSLRNLHTSHPATPSPAILRSYSTASSNGSTPTSTALESEPPTPALSSRWFADLQCRLRQLAASSLGAAGRKEAERLLQFAQDEWMVLVAGRQGFLTDERWRGLDRCPVVWGDMDSMGHVNNVMYNRYAESARVNWALSHGQGRGPEEQNRWEGLMTPRGVGLILKSIKTEFKFPLGFPDKVTVLDRLVEKPTYDADVLRLDVLILSERHRRVAARCEEEVAVYDYRSARKTVLPRDMVDRLAETYELQEEARRVAEAKAAEVIRAVERMESIGQFSGQRLLHEHSRLPFHDTAAWISGSIYTMVSDYLKHRRRIQKPAFPSLCTSQ